MRTDRYGTAPHDPELRPKRYVGPRADAHASRGIAETTANRREGAFQEALDSHTSQPSLTQTRGRRSRRPPRTGPYGSGGYRPQPQAPPAPPRPHYMDLEH